MSKDNDVHVESKTSGPLGGFIPGPDASATATDSDGNEGKGYGDTRAEAESNARSDLASKQ